MLSEIKVFLSALMFFTRIPCPFKIGYSAEMLNQASTYFPMMGWIVGGLSALVFYLSSLVLPVPVAVFISMISSIFITGAFHEDGFADFCDGFGGGWTQEKILEIMKDSRIGVFGAIGIILMLGFKFLLLISFPKEIIPIVLVVGHSLSRLFSNTFLISLEYVRADLQSKAKPLATKISALRFIISIITGVAPILFLEMPVYLLILVPLIPLKLFFRRYLLKWLGGYTGDCLGAMQQISEVIIYLSLLIILINLV